MNLNLQLFFVRGPSTTEYMKLLDITIEHQQQHNNIKNIQNPNTNWTKMILDIQLSLPFSSSFSFLRTYVQQVRKLPKQKGKFPTSTGNCCKWKQDADVG